MILNVRTIDTEEGMYIGRGSAWGNPFVIGIDGDREQVIYKFANHMFKTLAQNPLWLEPLRGKDLLCYCAPLACHGDVIEKYLNLTKEIK